MGNQFPISSSARAWERYSQRVKTENTLVIVSFYDPDHPNGISLWAWARLQEPPLTWTDSKRLIESGAITAYKGKSMKWMKRKAWMIDVDPTLVASHGLLHAVRCAGWKKPKPQS